MEEQVNPIRPTSKPTKRDTRSYPPQALPRTVLAGCCFILLTIVLAACGAANSPQGTSAEPTFSLKYAYYPALHSAPLFVAAEAGYWQDLGLDVEMIKTSSGSTMRSQLVAGRIDLTNSGIDDAALLRQEGKRIMSVFPLVTRDTHVLVARDEALERIGVSPGDPLKERIDAVSQLTIGYTTPNSPSDVLARLLLSRAGVPESERGDHLVSVGGGTQMGAALESGQIDAFFSTPPEPNVPVIQGYGKILVSLTKGELEELTDYPYTNVSVRKSWLQDSSNERALVRFIAGLIKADRLINSDPEQARQYVHQFFPEMDQEVMRVGFHAMLPAIPESPQIDSKSVRNVLDVAEDFPEAFPIRGSVSAEEGVLWTDKYMQRAQEFLNASRNPERDE